MMPTAVAGESLAFGKVSDSDLKNSLLRRSSHLALCTGQFLETIRDLRARGQTDAETIWNAAFHVNVVDHDISVLLYFETTVEDVWAQRTVARMLATILYEAIEDLSVLFGQSFIQACKTAGIYHEIETNFRSTKKKLGDFSKANHTFLKGIRVNAGAHREHDAVDFITAVISADDSKMVNLACEFCTILLELGRLSMEAIEKVNAEYRRKGVI